LAVRSAILATAWLLVLLFKWPLKPPRIDIKYVGRSWRFRVTWRHGSRNHLITNYCRHLATKFLAIGLVFGWYADRCLLRDIYWF